MTPEKEGKSRTRIGLTTAVAMLAGIAGGVKSAEAHTPDIDSQTISHLSKENDLNKFSEDEIKKLEDIVESDKLPLHLQVKFIGEALREDGPYARELSDRKLSTQRLSRIGQLTNAVSARLTVAYTDWKKHPELQKHFLEADKMREATSLFPVERNGKTEYCNRFLVNDSNEAFSVTAFHCINGTIHENEYYRPPYTDIAVKYIPKEKWELNGVKDISSLPEVNRKADRFSISGKVVTAFSRGMDDKPRVHFSFAMPLPMNLSLMFSDKEMPKLTLLGAQDWMMYFKPYSEGQRNPETGRVNAASSSGGPIAVEGFGVAGTNSATKAVSDDPQKVSYASSFFTAPDTFHRAISEERATRSRRIAAGDMQ